MLPPCPAPDCTTSWTSSQSARLPRWPNCQLCPEAPRWSPARRIALRCPARQIAPSCHPRQIARHRPSAVQRPAFAGIAARPAAHRSHSPRALPSATAGRHSYDASVTTGAVAISSSVMIAPAPDSAEIASAVGVAWIGPPALQEDAARAVRPAASTCAARYAWDSCSSAGRRHQGVLRDRISSRQHGFYFLVNSHRTTPTPAAKASAAYVLTVSPALEPNEMHALVSELPRFSVQPAVGCAALPA